MKINVKDNGKGIEESDYERVFDPLWTTYKGADDSGTGMGMTIVREIIEDEFEGMISVKSSKSEKTNPSNGGTTIQFRIPLDYLKGEKK